MQREGLEKRTGGDGLLAARLAETTLASKPKLVSDPRPAAVKRAFELFLSGLVAGTGTGAGVIIETEQDPKDADTHWVHCKIRMGNQVLGGAIVEFSLRF